MLKPERNDVERLLERASRAAKARYVALCGLAALAVLQALVSWVRARVELQAPDVAAARAALEDSSRALSENAALRDLRAKDVARFKADLSKLTQSRRALFEGGLQVQEEYRLLLKQYEIMTTYLLVDEESHKVHLMRGEQSLESFSIGHTPQAFGGETKEPAPQAAIVSKERFAHPERGKSETVDGQLKWEPPQVGESVRANALGEYVMFVKGSLILHGPPKKPAEHLEFPHYCLGLTLPVARRLYSQSYIGTRVRLQPSAASVLLKKR
jgi:hypothetical protein